MSAAPGRLVDKSPARIADMFDAIAPRYDTLNHLLSAGLDRRWRWHAVTALALTGTETVLDLCTGTGDLAVAATRGPAAGAGRVVGVDFAAGMLRLGQAKSRRLALTGTISFVRGDAEWLPLPADSIDAVTIGFGIRNVGDPTAVCREIRRVLRPGGRLAILEFGLPRRIVLRTLYRWYFTRLVPRLGRLVSRHPDAYAYLPASVGAFLSPAAMSRLLRETGFREVRGRPLSGGIVHLHLAGKS